VQRTIKAAVAFPRFRRFCRHDVNGSLAMSSRHTLWLTWASGGSAEDYNNPNIHTHVTRYTEIGKALHGDTWDPATAPLSGEAIMRAGGGKKHDRYWLGDSIVDTASTPTLSQLRARTTNSTPPILSRSEISVVSMHAFQAWLDEEKRLWQELEERLEQERKLREEQEQRVAAMFVYMQGLGASINYQPPPTMPWPPPTAPPPHLPFAPMNQLGVASNEPLDKHSPASQWPGSRSKQR